MVALFKIKPQNIYRTLCQTVFITKHLRQVHIFSRGLKSAKSDIKVTNWLQFDGLSFSFSGVHTGGFSTVSKTVFVLVLVFVGLFRGLVLQ